MPSRILNTNSSVKPTILNGSKSSQIKGSKKNKTTATGQEIENKINHRIITINTLMM
ncbi:MAG: hypothetical protein ABJG41_20930 [Cyclobacteriaceae bacterium]